LNFIIYETLKVTRLNSHFYAVFLQIDDYFLSKNEFSLVALKKLIYISLL